GLDEDISFIRRDDLVAFSVCNCNESITVFDEAGNFRFTSRLLSDTCCSTTDVEGSQCELCTWFTNRLSCNDTNSFTFINQVHGCKVTAVAHLAKTTFGFAGEHRTDIDG